MIDNICVIAKNIVAPTIYGIIDFLYSAFSDTLPVIYLIPSTISVATKTMTPTMPIILVIILALSTIGCTSVCVISGGL